MVLLRGCAETALAPEIRRAATRLLEEAGRQIVEAPGEGCCGGLHGHLGHEAEAVRAARRNARAWSSALGPRPFDLVAASSGCAVSLRDCPGRLPEGPAAATTRDAAARARDLTSFLDAAGWRPSSPVGAGLRIALHSPCTLRHGLKSSEAAERLLLRAGYAVAPDREPAQCCGAAGVYNLTEPQIAEALGRRKAAALAEGDPRAIATSNIGCLLHLRRFSRAPVLHVAELLASGPEA